MHAGVVRVVISATCLCSDAVDAVLGPFSWGGPAPYIFLDGVVRVPLPHRLAADEPLTPPVGTYVPSHSLRARV